MVKHSGETYLRRRGRGLPGAAVGGTAPRDAGGGVTRSSPSAAWPRGWTPALYGAPTASPAFLDAVFSHPITSTKCLCLAPASGEEREAVPDAAGLMGSRLMTRVSEHAEGSPGYAATAGG